MVVALTDSTSVFTSTFTLWCPCKFIWGCVRKASVMSRADRAINSEVGDWGYSEDAGERARLLQSPSVDSIQLPNQSDNRRGGTSTLGAVFIVVNAALGAGLLNFPAAFNMAGGVTAGVTLQMVRETYGLL